MHISSITVPCCLLDSIIDVQLTRRLFQKPIVNATFQNNLFWQHRMYPLLKKEIPECIVMSSVKNGG